MPIELNPVKKTHAVWSIINQVIDKDYPYLRQLQPEFDLRVIMAEPPKAGVPAVRKNKRGVVAMIDITPYKMRVRGAGDAGLTIDASEWKDLTTKQQCGIIAEKLESLDFANLRSAGDGLICDRDHFERPVIELKNPDVAVEGFAVVIRRYGDDSEARQELSRIAERLRQTDLPFDSQEELEHVAPEENDEGLQIPTTTSITFRTKDFPVIREGAEKLRAKGKREIDEAFRPERALA